jgi:hypothetical protein
MLAAHIGSLPTKDFEKYKRRVAFDVTLRSEYIANFGGASTTDLDCAKQG